MHNQEFIDDMEEHSPTIRQTRNTIGPLSDIPPMKWYGEYGITSYITKFNSAVDGEKISILDHHVDIYENLDDLWQKYIMKAYLYETNQRVAKMEEASMLPWLVPKTTNQAVLIQYVNAYL
jgi:hypothetical protein